MRYKTMLLVLAIWCLMFVAPVGAIYDPLSVPNNKFGVHIFDPSEIDKAAVLVNSNGGQWGYVTVPIRLNDRDRDKWEKFMRSARKLKVIPIIRLASYPQDTYWVKPDYAQVEQLINFLTDLSWPIKNRYLIFFNEPNHSKEWGGEIKPEEYAELLIKTAKLVKAKSSDYFLLSGGLDMAAGNTKLTMDGFEFYRRMNAAFPAWLDFVDGLSVHAYPNPGFIGSPLADTRRSIVSYRYEQNYLKTKKPIFITETGTIATQSDFYPIAFNQVWTDANIVAITPFVLYAGSNDFAKFSLLQNGFLPSKHYLDIERLPKIMGSPVLAMAIIEQSRTEQESQPMIVKSWFTKIRDWVKAYLVTPTPTPIPKVTLNTLTLDVEIASTESSRAKGLSGRTSLPDNHGMLFLFDNLDRHKFWMKDMLIPLDFIWLREGQVVELHQNVQPPAMTNGNAITLEPGSVVDMVLEVPAGFIMKNQIRVGDKFTCNCK